jgi:hypothetical protein
MSISSARCRSAVRFALLGQSMFATVAIHSPRISRASGLNAVSAGGGGGGGGGSVMPGASPHAARNITATRRYAYDLEGD